MKLCALLLAAMLCTLCVGQASALEYTMNAPDDYLFGRPTSDDTIYEWENPNVDRSKNTALIPPTFGSPTSYLPGTGTPLTPNLIPGALTGGGLVTQTGGVTYPTVGGSPGGNSGAGSAATGWTDVTGDLYYSGGHLGTLKIPAIGLSTKVYQGTGSSVLAKGAGHFLDTSIWAGNVCIAGHNRGVRDDFGDLHTLEPGDTVTWTTKLGTRTYLPQIPPSQADSDYYDDLAEQIVKLLDAANGHALGLFTSYAAMSAVRERLKQRDLPYPVLTLGRNGGHTMSEFMAHPGSVLLAAGAAWEGFDFPGDCVSLLILPRLPFPMPDAVKEQERMKHATLHDFLRAVVVPEMQIKLRQGFGRAIRTETDTCVVAILDERAGKDRRYFRDVLTALPEVPVTHSLKDVERFIRAVKPEGYFQEGAA